MGNDGETLASDDRVCRFIPLRHWNSELGQPSPQAFRSSRRKVPKRHELSIFQVDGVVSLGSKLRDLCIESLDGAGEAHLDAGDFIEARDAADSDVFDPSVIFRPDFADTPWEPWKTAHAHEESDAPANGFPKKYLVDLVKRVTATRPPDA